MPKIDCSKTENFLRELGRATDNCNIHCKDCIINNLYMKDKCGCIDAIAKYSQEAISVIQSWSDTHPIKTRLDDLKEKYPNFRMDIDKIYPAYYPHVFGYCKNCLSCTKLTSNNSNKACWDEPLEGGATGE